MKTETMPEVLKYAEEELRTIRTTTPSQHPSNPLSNFTMSWFIDLGIKRQPVEKPYRDQGLENHCSRRSMQLYQTTKSTEPPRTLEMNQI